VELFCLQRLSLRCSFPILPFTSPMRKALLVVLSHLVASATGLVQTKPKQNLTKQSPTGLVQPKQKGVKHNLSKQAPTGLVQPKQKGVKQNSSKAKGSKESFKVVFDTTCSDCQHWIQHQFKPLWNDTAARNAIVKAFDLEFLAVSVTKHKQGFRLSNILNCAHHELELPVFLESLFCWEPKVFGWAPIPGSGEFEETTVDEEDLMNQCMPAAVKACASDYDKMNVVIDELNAALPAEGNEVPWLIVGSDTFSSMGNGSAIYNLAGFLQSRHVNSSAIQKAAKAAKAGFVQNERSRDGPSVCSHPWIAQNKPAAIPIHF